MPTAPPRSPAPVPSRAPAPARPAPVNRTAPRGVSVPGVPEGVEVRRSPRRRRTVTAFREDGRTVVLVPARMPVAEIAAYVHELVGRLESRERRGMRSDAALERRAGELSAQYLAGRAVPTSVRWVTNQRSRWGSCTPVDGTIRLSHRLGPMPSYVQDYVLLHELAHLIEPGHGAPFEALLVDYPHLHTARAFLDGVAHAAAHGSPAPDASDPLDASDTSEATAASDAPDLGDVVDVTDPVTPVDPVATAVPAGSQHEGLLF